MIRRFISLIECVAVGVFLMFAASCGTSKFGGQTYGGIQRPADAPASMMKSKNRGDRELNAIARDYDGTPKSEARKPDPQEPKPSKPAERMVIYHATFTMQVESVRQTLNDVKSLVDAAGGFIESAITSDSYRAARMVLRVPVREFDKTLRAIERIGEVVNREVSASDVTMEFQDISLRLDTARKVRDRLYLLLKRARRASDRVSILKEIERLTTQIDSMTARLTFLKNRASFSTIILDIRAKVKEVSRSYIPSPFSWIANLDPNKRSIFDSGGKIGYEKMTGFFLMKDEYYDRNGNFLFLTPDRTTGIRIGVVDNYPPADMEFWHEALRQDLSNRLYAVKRDNAITGGKSAFRAYEIGLTRGVYLVAFSVAGERIAVIEAVYPDEASYKKYHAQVLRFIQTVEVK